MNETTPDSRFPCELCEKVCKSQHGLTMHKNTKHQQQIPTTSSSTVNSEKITEEKLRPLYFIKYVNESAIKLSKDECYSQTTHSHFEGYKLSLDEANQAYNYVREVIGEFKGNAEKFYPKFYKCVSSENSIFRNLPRRSVILGCEVANHVLAHLTGASVKDSSVEFSVPTYSTIYGCLKFSKATQSMLGMQCLPLLLAGKSSLENSHTENDSLIHAKDRSGLWNVTPEVYFIFSQVETLFRQATNFDKQIDGKKMVSQLLENPSILSNFNKVRNQSAEII